MTFHKTGNYARAKVIGVTVPVLPISSLSCSCWDVKSCLTLCLHGLQQPMLSYPSPSPSVHWVKLMSTESVMPSNHLILCHHLLLLPSIFPSIRVFSNESILHIRWPKHWNFSFSISPNSDYSELISFRIDFEFFSVQGTLKSLLQHQSLKSSILQHPVFFTVQLSHPHMTTRKTKALTTRTFVSKVISLFLICCLGWS